VCKGILYYCHRVSTQLQLNIYTISYTLERAQTHSFLLCLSSDKIPDTFHKSYIYIYIYTHTHTHTHTRARARARMSYGKCPLFCRMLSKTKNYGSNNVFVHFYSKVYKNLSRFSLDVNRSTHTDSAILTDAPV
jgi:hypothetical protein